LFGKSQNQLLKKTFSHFLFQKKLNFFNLKPKPKQRFRVEKKKSKRLSNFHTVASLIQTYRDIHLMFCLETLCLYLNSHFNLLFVSFIFLDFFLPYLHSFIHSSVHSFIYSPMYSLIITFIHSFIRCLGHRVACRLYCVVDRTNVGSIR